MSNTQLLINQGQDFSARGSLSTSILLISEFRLIDLIVVYYSSVNFVTIMNNATILYEHIN